MPESSLNLMSYNIRFDLSWHTHWDDDAGEAHHWRNRRPRVAKLLKKWDPDIVGLQEPFRHQLDDLIHDFPEYTWCGRDKDGGTGRGEFTAIFFKRERFQVLADGTFWLSENPYQEGSIGWDAKYPRTATWVHFWDETAQQRFFVFNTHFDHKGPTARFHSAQLIRKKIKKITNNTLTFLLGDFNTKELSSPAYQELVKEDLLVNTADIADEPHQGPIGTYNEFEPTTPDILHDHIFASSHLQVLSHYHIDEKVDNLYPSDHLPVFTQIQFP